MSELEKAAVVSRMQTLASEIEETLKTVREATDEVRNSRSLRAVLGALLGLGNHMNGGTAKGQADGFALGDLGKMSVTKDSSNTISLLEYAVLAIHETQPECTAIASELALLREAGKVKLADVRAALQKLTGEARELQVASCTFATGGCGQWL